MQPFFAAGTIATESSLGPGAQLNAWSLTVPLSPLVRRSISSIGTRMLAPA